MKNSNEPAAVPARPSTLPAARQGGEIRRACSGIRLLLHSSDRLPWSGLSLERRSHGSGTWNTPPLDGHMLCLYVGPACSSITGGFISLHLSRSLVAQAESELARSRQRLAVVDRFCIVDEALAWIGQALHREVLDGGMHGTLCADSLAAALAARMLVGHADHAEGRRQGSRQLRPAALQRVLDHIATSTLRQRQHHPYRWGLPPLTLCCSQGTAAWRGRGHGRMGAKGRGLRAVQRRRPGGPWGIGARPERVDPFPGLPARGRMAETLSAPGRSGLPW